MPGPRFSLPASSARHAAPPPNNPLKAGQDVADHMPPGGRKLRPLVYAIGVAGIVGSGALIGAILKMDHQEEQQKVSLTSEYLPHGSYLTYPFTGSDQRIG